MDKVNMAYIAGRWRPIQKPRTIKRGRNKGRIEAFVSKMRSKDGGWRIGLARIILDPDQIRWAGKVTEYAAA